MSFTKNSRKTIHPEKPNHLPSIKAPSPPPGNYQKNVMNKKYHGMIIELILFYWIGLQPSKKIDGYIQTYMEEMNLNPDSLVSENNRLKKDNDNGSV